MKQKKRVFKIILTLVCCLCVFLGSGMESRAEEEFEPRSGTFEFAGNTYTYYCLMGYRTSYDNFEFTEPAYGFSFICDGKYGVIFLSKEYLQYRGQNISTGNYGGYGDFSNRGDYYELSPIGKTTVNFPIPQECPSGQYNNLLNSFREYFMSDEFNDLYPFIPDFNHYYHEDTDRWLNDLRAQVEDNTLYATWDGLAGIGLHVLEGYENMFVQFHLQFIDDKGTTNISDDEYTDLYDFYTELELNEFSVDLSEFDVPEGYRLWCMWAEPYWYFNDDINSTMFKGKLSYLFFDEDGMSDAPLIKDTGDIYNPLDPNLSNWNAITNFTGDYFYNMGNVMNNTFNNWDSTSMDESNRYLGDSLANYGNHENAIVNQVSSNLEGFEFDYYLSFSDKVNAGIAFGSSLINKFFTVSGDFTILFVVGCVMVFIFVVVGIWRFSK